LTIRCFDEDVLNVAKNRHKIRACDRFFRNGVKILPKILFHSHFLLLSYSVLRGGHVHINDLLSGPAPFDEHLGLKVEGADAVGRIEGHAVFQAATVGQELVSLELLWQPPVKRLCVDMSPDGHSVQEDVRGLVIHPLSRTLEVALRNHTQEGLP